MFFLSPLAVSKMATSVVFAVVVVIVVAFAFALYCLGCSRLIKCVRACVRACVCVFWDDAGL